ncbi:MAG: hypothetical protein CMH55_09955 [Myxococcales bacterium]|nr:hypothetical protein [Myxococcales bacterium]
MPLFLSLVMMATPGVDPVAEPAPAHSADLASAPAAETTPEGKRYRFVLSNGTELVGRMVERIGKSKVKVALLDGTVRTLFWADVEAQFEFEQVTVGGDGSVWDRNPNRTRHLYAPSAMPLKAGEGYLSLKEVFFLSGAYGVTDNVSVLMGSLVPTLFLMDGSGFIGAVKVAGELGEDFYVAGGGEVLTVPSFDSSRSLNLLGIGFAGITVGKPDKQVTLSAGRPFALSGSEGADLGDALLVVAGQFRLTNSVGIVSENWIFPNSDGPDGPEVLSLHALAIRRISKNFAWDAGLIGVAGSVGAFPWIDFTWNIGTARRVHRPANYR